MTPRGLGRSTTGSRRLRTVALAVTFGALALTLSGCSWQEVLGLGWPKGITPESHANRDLWLGSVIAAFVVVGAVLEFAPIDVHAMAIMGAITFQSFNEVLAAGSYKVVLAGTVRPGGGSLLKAGKQGCRGVLLTRHAMFAENSRPRQPNGEPPAL